MRRKTAAVTTKHRADWKIYQDYRKLIEQPDLDAVIVAACDHHHVLASILACQAGKDVYCEKPLSLYIREGRALVTAARKYGRVVQHGTQQRTMEMNRFACEFVRDGGIGKIRAVECVNFKGPIPYPAEGAAGRTDSGWRRLGPLAGPGTGASVQPETLFTLDRRRRELVGQLARLFKFPIDRPGFSRL